MQTITTPATMLRVVAPSVAGRIPSVRALHASSSIRSHIGSLPLPIPSSVKLELPILSLPPTSHSSASASSTPVSHQRSIGIIGPLGRKTLKLPPSVILNPSSSASGSATDSDAGGPNVLALTVQDSSIPHQRASWGLTRALLSNAITGVSEGYRVVLRLVGVGYRASVEPIPPALRAILETRARSPSTSHLSTPTNRINMKLGYAHPVYVDIPSDVTVSTPQPTRIVLSGTDKQRLGLFAAKIRRWRKPEPYRGKGIFVGDETIKLKEVKKK